MDESKTVYIPMHMLLYNLCFYQEIGEIVESSDDEEFIPPIHDFEEPESRFVLGEYESIVKSSH